MLSKRIGRSSKRGQYKSVFMAVMMAVIVLTSGLQVDAASNEESYAGNQLRILGILRGYEDGSLRLDNPIKRAEVAALTVRILGYEGVELEGETRDFTDVEKDYWAAGVIQNAYKLKIIQGYPDMTFKPLDDITYAEVVAIMVNALGQQEELVGDWPLNYINRGKAVGIIPTDSSVEPDKVVTRGEMSVIVWDTLLVKD